MLLFINFNWIYLTLDIHLSHQTSSQYTVNFYVANVMNEQMCEEVKHIEGLNDR